MPIAVAVAAAAVAAGTAAAAAQQKRSAEKKAISAQKKAIKSEKDIDVEYEKGRVSDQDKQQYIESMQFFREQNPELAAARDQAAVNIMQDLQTGSVEERKLLNQMIAENRPLGETDLLATEIQKAAREDLALGSSLPADYQAELTRLGLEEAGGAGVGFDRSGAVTQKLGTMIGKAGVDLRQQRMNTAQNAAQLGESVRSNRASILQGLINSQQGIRAFDTSQAASAINLARQETPVVGMSGQDVLNLDIANIAAKNKRLRELANLKAQNAQSAANERIGYFQAFNQGSQTFANMYGSGGGGGQGGGGGFNFGSMGSGGGGGTTNYGTQMSQMKSSGGF